MSDAGVTQARTKMAEAGVDSVAIEVFAHYYEQVASGATGMVPESTIEPLDMPALSEMAVDDEFAREALAGTVVIKLNGGLGTSMGMDRAKSLLPVRDDVTFLDVIVRQVLSLRERYDVKLPLIFMNSFRTQADTLAALEAYPDLEVDGLGLDFLQNREPKLRADDLTPVEWPADPSLEWCPPGHGDIYTALVGTGLLQRIADAGYTQVFVSNSDNLGAIADPLVAGWFASSGAPFAIEAVRRTPSDRKGGHFARRRSDGRIVLRETAQTLAEDKAALGDLGRHRFMSTNNLWFNVAAMQKQLSETEGILGLALIRNEKSVDPTDATSPRVIQIETAMGAAIEIFDDAATIEVERDRFVPVKTTNDLLVLRSDCYDIDDESVLQQVSPELPFVELSPEFAMVDSFEEFFPAGIPSLRQASEFVVSGPVTFGSDVAVVGAVRLESAQCAGRIGDGVILGQAQ